ncbi:galactosyldiacylglycerol synthase [Micromonospora olivasterospora]|uniref:UDP-N-acetylglucosamine:LPS N-acetylglucosamine transferase n=1 Tax=Micromonospora olivasterospora TaxID=1880 RepID=A0A562IFS3_MICOL|nr:UDP-N-acetylglucosamine:LPS N-acetylglucosamine transferase [Micromonospora olivasterospora]
MVSADVGAGHESAAAELTRRLRERGFLVDRLNFLDVVPAPARWGFRDAYRGVLRWAPWWYEAMFKVTGRSRRAATVLRALLAPLRRRMWRRIPPDTRAVVTTYPFANQLLGPLRRRGLSAPLLTYVTDFVVHPSWVSPGVDLYCALPYARPHSARLPADLDVRTVQPLVSADFAEALGTSKSEARRRFGLPADERLALVVAGAWGVGEVETTVTEVGAGGGVRTVVVCGRNDALRERLAPVAGHVFGWVDDMPTLMRAVDLVVENAGGLTCQEALACGLPVVTYRPIPGHGRANARILAAAGLTRWAPSRDHLQRELARWPAPGAHPPGREMGSWPDPAGLVAEVAARPSTVGWSGAYRRRPVADVVGDTLAVLATVLPNAGRADRR